ncbi:Chromosome-partitioning protein ParB [Pseudovibrio sp. Ad46]|uniref:plasmid partitioning protein RepB n=1 Tax=Pseudovibrio sp. Ad46 TaxID=989432 RepID=UPI0007AE8390|nr:plasmid partitioning protein RepB [Pseudovibrio sp. Ad46]KZK88044.1 Chromosome-partitioning protein ParB [Pseudovibrio sp. Ad46]
MSKATSKFEAIAKTAKSKRAPSAAPIMPTAAAASKMDSGVSAFSFHKRLGKDREIQLLNAKLCLPSMVADRAFENQSEDIDALAYSIEESGQEVPILVRPHPEKEGSYQIAYGHRRVLACRKLNIVVRAIVRELSDEELVIAQGKENAERKNLSYIQRANFAKNLNRDFPRAVIVKSIGGSDPSIVSKLLKSINDIPENVLEAIGPAHGIGRVKWQSFNDRMRDPKVRDQIERRVLKLKDQSDWFSSDSDERFVRVTAPTSYEENCQGTAATDSTRDRKEISASSETWSLQKGTDLLKMTHKKKGATLAFSGEDGSKFAQFLSERLNSLIEEYEEQFGRSTMT